MKNWFQALPFKCNLYRYVSLPPYHIDREELEKSVYLSHRWEARSLAEHLKDVRQQAMYAVIHGGVDVELRWGLCTS